MARGPGGPITETRQTTTQAARHGVQSDSWLLARPLRDSSCRAKLSRKTPLYIERLVLLQHMEAGPRQLVRQRLGGDDTVALRLLSIMEPLGLRAEALREVRRLDEGPGQVLVTVLGIAFAFLLAVGHALAVNTAAVRGEVTRLRKASKRGQVGMFSGHNELCPRPEMLERRIPRI